MRRGWGAGIPPAAGRERLDAEQRRVERVLLELRLHQGLPETVLTPAERRRLPELQRRGWLISAGGYVRVTEAGRLLADAAVRDLLD